MGTDRYNEKSSKRSDCRKKYHFPIIIKFLKDILKTTNLICSKRLKAIIPIWLPHYKSIGLTEKTRGLLLEISPATIDRLLSKDRNKNGKLGLATTKSGSIIKKRIPIKTNKWNESEAGFLEADTVAHCGTSISGAFIYTVNIVDTVAHCGTSISGAFIYTVNIVDIATGWTEQRAVWGKGQMGVFHAIESIENSLPFKILGFDSDYGTEFINYHIERYFTKRMKPVQYTRSRPYYKNDNAHIEQKNWTNIRQYLGYGRFENPEILELLNDLYEKEWRLFFNYFIPSVKLINKVRIDAKIIKKHGIPKTPYQRLIESETISKKIKRNLELQFRVSNPYELQKKIKEKIINILNLSNYNML